MVSCMGRCSMAQCCRPQSPGPSLAPSTEHKFEGFSCIFHLLSFLRVRLFSRTQLLYDTDDFPMYTSAHTFSCLRGWHSTRSDSLLECLLGSFCSVHASLLTLLCPSSRSRNGFPTSHTHKQSTPRPATLIFP